MCVFVYRVDEETGPVVARCLLEFAEVHLAHVDVGDFRRNERGERGTRTATLHREGVRKPREGWLHRR